MKSFISLLCGNAAKRTDANSCVSPPRGVMTNCLNLVAGAARRLLNISKSDETAVSNDETANNSSKLLNLPHGGGVWLRTSMVTLALAMVTTASVWAVETSGTILITKSQVISENIPLSGPLTFQVDTDVFVTVTGVISGTANYPVTVKGGGKVYFTGVNTYYGE